MSRERFIDPQIWTSEQVMACSPMARLMFIGIITTADDEGRRTGGAKALKAAIYPSDDVTASQISRWRQEIADAGLIRIYAAERYPEVIDIPNWSAYQKLKYVKPSKLPTFENRLTDNDKAKAAGIRRNPPESGGIVPYVKRGVVGCGAEGTGQEGTENDLCHQACADDEEDSQSSDSEPSNGTQPSNPDGPYESRGHLVWGNVQAWWNCRIASKAGLPVLRALSPDRRKHVLARRKEGSLDFEAIETECLRLTEAAKGWVSFPWLMKSANNLNKLLEGNYREMRTFRPETPEERRARQILETEQLAREAFGEPDGN
jgi:hypothetical protein